MLSQNIQKAGAIYVNLEGYGILLSGQTRIDDAVLAVTLLLLGLFSEETTVGFDIF